MSAVQLSPAQRAAVHHPLGDAVVLAGAGSGKTRVLTARYLHLVREHGIPMRRIAALTFTERAAREMRERIALAFEEAGDEGAVAEVEMADIGTLHAWCASLLRRHAVAAGVDPGFAVLDAAEMGLLVADAAAAAEAALAADAAGRAAWREVGALLTPTPRDALLGLLRSVRGAAASIRMLAWRHGGGDAAALRDRACGLLPDVLEGLDAVDAPDDVAPLVRAALGEIGAALALDDADVRAFRLPSAVAALPASTSVSRKAAWTRPRKALLDACEALTACDLDDVGERRLLPALRHVLGAYEHAYAAAKAEQGVLDFDDLEHGALGFLGRLEQAGTQLEAAPRVVLVDEFQDTSPVQARLLGHLRAQGAVQLIVGDPKQSIYRFRRADVRVLLGEQERVGAHGMHHLATSYRAAPDLVAVLNHVHGALFADGAAGVPYEALVAGGAFEAPLPGTPPMELRLLRLDGTRIDDATACEAQALATWLQDLVARGTPRRKAGVARTLGYGDIAILLRARSRLAIYEAALTAAGIPHRTLGGRGWHQADEIQDLRDVLRVVHDVEDRHALAAFLTGPAVGASDADVARWFDPGGVATPYARWCEAAREDPSQATIVAVLERLRDDAVLGSLTAVVEGALHDLGLLAAALAAPDGVRRAANLRKAVPLASALEAAGRRGLGDLLRQLARLDEEGADESEAPVGSEDDGAVRLMTVHAAKGLEFPVVVVADAGRGTGGGGGPLLRHDPEHGVAARLRDPLEGTGSPSGGHEALKAMEASADEQESLRLLYVAATRAEERLVVSASFKGVTKGGDPAGMVGWGRALVRVLGADLDVGVTEVPVGPADEGLAVRVTVLDGETLPPPVAPAAPGGPAGAAPVDAWLAGAAREPAPLGATRYVVSVSELVAFAASPARYHERYVLGLPEEGEAPARPVRGSALRVGHDDDEHEVEDATRRREDDEAGARPRGDAHAAAVGTATHAYLERIGAGETGIDRDRLDEVVADAFPGPAPDGVRARVHDLVARFLVSDIGRRLGVAVATREDVRREMAFHVRVRFPDGASVGPFDGLLVKGSMDLWLPTERGVLLVDHKTNTRSARLPTPEAVAAHYAIQLRLYALAAERLEGADVAGAGVLLLDPSWGPEALFVPVDVGGEALRATRRVVQALARAELEGRYPDRLDPLLADR